MEITEILENEIKNKFYEDWQNYIDDNNIQLDDQEETKEAFKEDWITENEDFLDAIIEGVDYLDEVQYLTDALDYEKYQEAETILMNFIDEL